MTRTFGVELEVSRGPRSRGLHPRDLATQMAAAGITAHYAGYTHAVTSDWKLVDDGSVTDGFELVSPILRGEEGFAQLRRLSPVLLGAGLKINRSCGFHVHIGIENLTGPQIASVIKRYAAHEAKIDAFMSPSRRLSNNTFCRSMVEFANNPVLDSPSLVSQLRQVRRDGGGDFRRYMKVNLCAYGAYRTIEFRQHQGTIEADKIINWVKFLMGFIEESVRRVDMANAPRRRRRSAVERMTAPAVTLPETSTASLASMLPSVMAAKAAIKAQSCCKPGTKTEQLIEKLMDGFHTAQELAQHAGLIRESGVATIMLSFRRRGIIIQTERPRGSKKKYRIALNAGLRAPLPVAAPVVRESVTTYIEPVIEPDKLFAGIESEVFKFYKGRAAQFGTSAEFEGAN